MREGEWLEKDRDTSVLGDPSGTGRTCRASVWSCLLPFICRRAGDRVAVPFSCRVVNPPNVWSCSSDSSCDLTSTEWRWRSPSFFQGYRHMLNIIYALNSQGLGDSKCSSYTFSFWWQRDAGVVLQAYRYKNVLSVLFFYFLKESWCCLQ